MVSRFVNLFKSTDQDEVRAFQRRVADLLIKLYPENQVSLADDPKVIEFDESSCGLPNIQAKFLASGGTDDDLVTILREHFDVFHDTKIIAERAELTWEEVQPNIMPQLMPAEFLAKIPLVHYPFIEGLVLGFVLDTEKAYSYISVSDMERWGVERAEIRGTAFENLGERSSGMAMNAFPRPNGFVAVTAADGFDAVRIMSKEMRQFIGEFLGTPFYFGIPNRDFLICWEASDDAEFYNRFAEQISADFDQQPYPLSRKTFRVTPEFEIETVEGTQDPRVETAVLN